MYDRIKRLYNAGKLDRKGVMQAVKQGWITEDQAKQILSER